MKIAAYTVGDINVASSRLRSFYLFHFADKHGIKVCRNSGMVKSLRCHYLHLQSCYTPKYVVLTILFRILGKKVFFDVGDIPSKKIHFAFFMMMAMLANVVTTPLETTRTYLGKYINIKKVIVIPDVLDVDPDETERLTSIHRKKSKGIFWTGHPGNLDSIEEFMRLLEFHKDYTLVVVTKLDAVEQFVQSYPWVVFLEWSVDAALNCKVDMSYALLNHAHDAAALYKCENKMVLSIALGLVPIVSRTPAYEGLATKLGADRLVFDNLAEVLNIIEKLEPEWIDGFLQRARDYVAGYYSSDNVLSIFLSRCLSAS